jgi:hypothetical protein
MKPRRDFDAALNAYLEAIQHKKEALLAAINQPSTETKKEFKSGSQNEKEARHVYRKATKGLRALIRNS